MDHSSALTRMDVQGCETEVWAVFSAADVAEPGTLGLLALGLFGAARARRRRGKGARPAVGPTRQHRSTGREGSPIGDIIG